SPASMTSCQTSLQWVHDLIIVVMPRRPYSGFHSRLSYAPREVPVLMGEQEPKLRNTSPLLRITYRVPPCESRWLDRTTRNPSCQRRLRSASVSRAFHHLDARVSMAEREIRGRRRSGPRPVKTSQGRSGRNGPGTGGRGPEQRT